jgi:putative nucleotidyltransferase with HDIG domain
VLDPKVISEQSIGLGTLPAVATRLIGLLDDQKTSLTQVEQVVRPDVALTANLLRYANSPAYRGARQIVSVKDAVVRLGARETLNVVMGASYGRLIPARLLGYGMTADAFWSHSVSVACLSDRIGREVGFASADLAFTAGLLHDLGKVVLATFLTTGAGLTARTPSGVELSSLEVEREHLGTDHTEIGEATAGRWQLPTEICAVVRWHHQPQKAPKASQRLLAATIALADALAKKGVGSDGGPTDWRGLVAAVDADVLVTLSLGAPRLERLLSDSVVEIVRTRDAFSTAVR